jgi:hypothetical protein
MKRTGNAVWIVIAMLAVAMSALAQQRSADWETFSSNIERCLLSPNEGVRLSAMGHIITYGEYMDVSYSAPVVMGIFRDHPDCRVRKLALITLSCMKSDWAMKFLRMIVRRMDDPALASCCKRVLYAWAHPDIAPQIMPRVIAEIDPAMRPGAIMQIDPGLVPEVPRIEK